jgi:hypothetical protein
MYYAGTLLLRLILRLSICYWGYSQGINSRIFGSHHIAPLDDNNYYYQLLDIHGETIIYCTNLRDSSFQVLPVSVIALSLGPGNEGPRSCFLLEQFSVPLWVPSSIPCMMSGSFVGKGFLFYCDSTLLRKAKQGFLSTTMSELIVLAKLIS